MTWNKIKLGNISKLITRGISPKYSDTEGLCVLNQKCIRGLCVDYSFSRLHNLTIKSVSDNKYLKDGDILINSTGTGTLGRVAQFVSKNQEVTVDSHVTIVRLDKEKVYSQFVLYQLFQLNSYIENLATGATNQKELSRTAISEEINIYLPDGLSTQKKIANILSTLQKRIEQIDKKIGLYKQLKRSMMEKLFTEGLRGEKQKMTKVGLIPESWGIKTLADLTIRSFSGGTPSTSRQDYWNGTIKWITSKTLVESSVSFQGHDRLISEEAVAGSATHIAKKGTLLVASRVGLGKVAVTNFDVAINQDIAGYEVNDEQIQADFLAWQILTDRIQRSILSSSRGATIKGVTRGALNDLMIGLPSKLEQKEIVYSLSTLEKHLTIIKNKKNIYNQIFRNLLDSMMTQKISIENITFEYQNEV